MLHDHVMLSTTDPDEARKFLAAKNLDLKLRPAEGPAGRGFYAGVNAIHADDFYIAHMTYGVDVAIDTPAEREDYGFSTPLSGRMATRDGAETTPCTLEATTLASPGAAQTMMIDGGARRLSLSLKRNLVRRRLALLTGEPIKGEIAFERDLNLKAGHGRMVLDAMTLAAKASHLGVDVVGRPARVAHLEETALSALLLYQPHSHRWLLDRPCAAPSSRDVRRAIDYIEAHLDAPIRLDDLVRAAGVPGRTLNDHFRAFVGVSPMEYLRKARMRAVRKALLAGETPTVTDAARRFGFLHLGRFSGAYAEAFGEPPSATLLRARGMDALEAS